jgi:hypothetical protein
MLMFHQHSGPVYDTLKSLLDNLDSAKIDHVIIGAFALGCHGYERATTDVDICVRKDDLERFRKKFVDSEYRAVAGRPRRFEDPRTGVTFDMLVSGELAGRTQRNDQIRFPDPSEAVTLKGLPTIPLQRLIELKLVTWRLRDWADVLELIRHNNLDEGFAQRLHPLIRMAYLECYDQKVEEDRYDIEA